MMALSSANYRAVFEASPDATLIVGATGKICDINQQVVAMFGWTRSELVGSGIEILVPEARRASHAQHRAAYSRSPQVRPMGDGLALLGLRKDNTTFPIEVSLSPWQPRPGSGFVICTVRDITAWKRLRKLSELMVRATEDERKRIARDLHDDVLQCLVALTIQLKPLVHEPDRQARIRAWRNLRQSLLHSVGATKRMIGALRPPALDRLGLVRSLADHFRDVRENSGLRIRARLEPVDSRLDGTRSLALYRIVQEALANVSRHADVDEATVTIETTGDFVVAEIRDCGCGFRLRETLSTTNENHMGLTGLEERATAVGGSMDIRTSPGNGTLVRATVPAVSTEIELRRGRRASS